MLEKNAWNFISSSHCVWLPFHINSIAFTIWKMAAIWKAVVFAPVMTYGATVFTDMEMEYAFPSSCVI